MRIGGVWGHIEAIQANFEPSKAPNEPGFGLCEPYMRAYFEGQF